MNKTISFDLRDGAGAHARRTIILTILVAIGIFWQSTAFSRQVAWPVETLRPPGTELPAPILSSVAVSDDMAVTGYAGSTSTGFRVYSRSWVAGAWSTPQLLVQGLDSSDSAVTLSADFQRLAVGSPLSGGGGRVAIYKHGAGTAGWILEQSIAAPNGANQFGKTVSLRGNLVVVTSAQNNGAVYSFRFDTAQSHWADAGFQFENSLLGSVSAVTDGNRIAYCRPLMQSGCATTIYTEAAGWQTESMPSPAVTSSGVVVGVGASDLFVRTGTTLAIYKGTGPQRVFSEKIAFIDGLEFSTDGARFVASTFSAIYIFDPGPMGSWVESSQLSVSHRLVAIHGDRVLADAQSLRNVAGNWIPTGMVDGLKDLTGSSFGIVEVVGDQLWIGAPGFDSSDNEAGSVWIRPLNAGSIPLSGPTLIPASPALGDYFGSRVVADSGRVAVASAGPGLTNGGVGRVKIFDATSHTLLQAIDLPDLASYIDDIALSGDTLAIARGSGCIGTCQSEVLVYRDYGTGFALAQTIAFPVGATYADFGFTLRIRGDWLLSGKLMFHRPPFGEFVYVAELQRFSGDNWGTQLSQTTSPMAVAIWTNEDRIGLVYAFDDATGWSLSGSVKDGSRELFSSCLSLDIGSSGIGCVARSYDGERLFLAAPDAVGSDWSIVGASAPWANRWPPGERYTMRMVDDLAIVGRTDTDHELAGSAIGMVKILTFNDTIFANIA